MVEHPGAVVRDLSRRSDMGKRTAHATRAPHVFQPILAGSAGLAPHEGHRYLTRTEDAVLELIPAQVGWHIAIMTRDNITGSTKPIRYPEELARWLDRVEVEIPQRTRWAGRQGPPSRFNPYADGGIRGHVYFVQGELSRLIKVGTSVKVLERIQDLAWASPDKLALLGVMPGGKTAEQALQRVFWEYHSHGEWFRPNRWLEAFIADRDPAKVYPLIAPPWRTARLDVIDPPWDVIGRRAPTPD